MQEAILLLGPTGAGKSPLGDYLAANGLYGSSCFHFDFGCELRRIAYEEVPGWTRDDIERITGIIEKGRLLERSEFSLALRILNAFKSRHGNGLFVLNGLPRHLQQAEDLEPHLTVHRVVILACTPEVALERIRLNTGGDRDGRRDDSAEKVHSRLMLYQARTQPIINFYRQKRVHITSVQVDVDTKACDVARYLDRSIEQEKPGS